MVRLFKLLVMAALFSFSSLVLAANEATGFVYPVGRMFFSPTEQTGNGNGFHISQNFNTGSAYGGSPTSPNGGWCNNKTNHTYESKSDCEADGYKWVYGHTGVDLAKDGGGCGDPIYATANGVVVFSKAVDGYGYLLELRHTIPNGRVIYSLYGHRQSAMMSSGQIVTKEQIVGYVGDTGSVVNGQVQHDAPCHLHFAIYDQDMPNAGGSVPPPGYVYDDSGNPPDIAQSDIMRHFYDPLLFVSDRLTEPQVALPGTGYWSIVFSDSQSVTTRTMFVVTSAGDAKSLQAAVDAGWVSSDVLWWNGSTWMHYTSPWPIESYTIPANAVYAFNMLRSDLTLHWFLPGNEYLIGRWLQDMYEFTAVNASLGFGRGLRDTYGSNPNWDPSYGLAYMSYEQRINGVLYQASVNVAYSKTDPITRYVCYLNPVTNVWSDWVQVH